MSVTIALAADVDHVLLVFSHILNISICHLHTKFNSHTSTLFG